MGCWLGDTELFTLLFNLNPSFRQKYHIPSAQLKFKRMLIFFDGINYVDYTNFSLKVQRAVP